MDPKPCTACHAPHFEDWDLCRFCAAERQRALEERLREDDGALSLMTIAAMVLYGRQPRFRRAWKIG